MTSSDTPTVLFLCTGNYYRSRYAEILFNHLAAERGMAWRAGSRGLDLALGVDNVGPLSPHTRLACEAGNLRLPDPLRGPLALCEADLRGAGVTIALKEAEHRPYLSRLFPEWAGRVRYWHVHDLDRAPAQQAIAEIDQLVRALVAELAELGDGASPAATGA
jgi:protein-tyrosine phosphatase